MAKPGRKPKPSVIHEAEGGISKTHRAKAYRANEPKPGRLSKLPPAPKFLNRVGKKEWRRVGKELSKNGLLTKIDLMAFGGYCVEYQTWVEAVGKINTFGMMIKSKNGFPIQSPYVSIARNSLQAMIKIMTEFGMTPSSRARVSVDTEPAVDPAADFIERGKIKIIK